jgi:uncharacterized protein YjiS (DUF1127 family)
MFHYQERIGRQAGGGSLAGLERVASVVAAKIAQGFDTLALWRERRAARSVLASFDDRLLKDIGITRSEALAELHKPFWRG